MAPQSDRIDVDELQRRIGRGEQFTFIDTRNPVAWAESDTKIPGAIRVPADEVEQRAGTIPRNRPIVTYCT
jgi:rhodanese-related sulfurtransferase